MKTYLKMVSLFIIVTSLTFCAMKQEFQAEFPQEIQSVFYQKEDKGNEDDVIYFCIEFKKPLATTIKLEKSYFHKQMATVEEITKNIFVVYFKEGNKKEDLILDLNSAKEYGNKAPILEKSKFDLKPDEAVVEYKNNNKTQFFKIKNLIKKAVE